MAATDLHLFTQVWPLPELCRLLPTENSSGQTLIRGAATSEWTLPVIPPAVTSLPVNESLPPTHGFLIRTFIQCVFSRHPTESSFSSVVVNVLHWLLQPFKGAHCKIYFHFVSIETLILKWCWPSYSVRCSFYVFLERDSSCLIRRKHNNILEFHFWNLVLQDPISSVLIKCS